MIATVHFILVCQTLFGDNFFYYFCFIAEAYMICVKVLNVLRNEFSIGSDKKLIFFPIDTHCKNRSLWQRHVYRHEVAKLGDFYNGVYWEILCLLSDLAENSFPSNYIKTADIYHVSFS